MTKDRKKKNRNKSDYGDNFIPPDGGYAWVICVTSGLSNLSLLPVFQQFGILYRDKLLGMGLSHSAITSIVNTNAAVASLSGFLNGPMFRRFSYRQVGILGCLILTISIYLTSISNNLESFLFTFGILLAFGVGIALSANSLVFNVYFKEKRSIASSWTWTITGIGPVIFPYIVTYLVQYYGVQGAILIITGISANAIAFALTYQPVLWHVKKNKKKISEIKPLTQTTTTDDDKYLKSLEYNTCKKCYCIVEDEITTDDNNISESSKDDDDDDDDSSIDLQIITQDPDTPMMHTKENFYKSNDNLAMKYTRQLSKYSISKSIERRFSLLSSAAADDTKFNSKYKFCKCNTKVELKKNVPESNGGSAAMPLKTKKSKLPLYRKFINYFELDLLKNFTFVNIIFGLTLSMFAELNFTILTPFFLADFELEQNQIAFLMAMPAIPDLACRFLIQFIVKKIKLDNRIFYLFGIFGTTLFRFIVAFRPSYNIMCIAFFFIGIGKAFRTIFYAIIIPDFVPLKNLPAALGVNRLFGGIFPLIFGPIIGIIRDQSNYQVTLHVLNILPIITVISWSTELIFVHMKKKKNLVNNSGNV